MLTTTSENPLLTTAELPLFDKIQASHVEPAVKFLLQECHKIISKVETEKNPSWESTAEPLLEISNLLERIWGPVGHLNSVKNSSELRAAVEKTMPEIIELQTRIGQSKPIYQALKAIKQGSAWTELEPAKQRSIELSIKDAELTGVGLDEVKRERFNAIEQELSQLGLEFSNNVLDATKAWGINISEISSVEGLPANYLEVAAQAYNRANPKLKNKATGVKGPWRLTIDAPSYLAVMQFAKKREIREQVYMARIQVASKGEFSNVDLLPKIVALSQEKSELLGYKTFAHLSTEQKMAGTPEAVYNLYNELQPAARKKAEQDLQELEQFGKAEAPLKPWDHFYWAKRLEEQKFNFTEDELRPFLPHPQILEGLFNLAHKLFNIKVVKETKPIPRWHEDVEFYNIISAESKHIASFYYDPYVRSENKRGGAWMEAAITKSIQNGKEIIPVAFICTNIMPPAGKNPALMGMTEVTTLFHEFGHALQHMLTTINIRSVSGISGIEWDAVELASTFMENWCYHLPTFLGMAKKFDTGETIPTDLAQKVIDSKNFRIGSFIIRQMLQGKFDLKLFGGLTVNTGKEVIELFHQMAKEILPHQLCMEDAFPCAFAHIFAGGYRAGYYSYIWSDILSADAFAAFQEAGLENEQALREVGKRYAETILGMGGARHSREVFKLFRGRSQQTAAYLKHNGFI